MDDLRLYTIVGLILIVLILVSKSRTTTIKRPKQGFENTSKKSSPYSNSKADFSSRIFKLFFSVTGAKNSIQKKIEMTLLDSHGEIKQNIDVNDQQLKSLIQNLDKMEAMGVVSPELAQKIREKWG